MPTNNLLWFSSECRQFMLLSLELLADHLSLATAARAPPSVLGQHSRPLRLLLFRLLDETISDDLQEVREKLLLSLYTVGHFLAALKSGQF